MECFTSGLFEAVFPRDRHTLGLCLGLLTFGLFEARRLLAFGLFEARRLLAFGLFEARRLLASGLFEAGWLSLILIFIIKAAMAISFEVRVGHLVTELLADALVLFRALQTAWTVAAFGLEAFADHRHDFLVFVETDSHYFSTPK